VSTVIAEREVEVLENQHFVPGNIQIFAPEMHPEDRDRAAYWTCKIALNFGTYERARDIHGVDAFQALQLALKTVPVEIEMSPAFQAGQLQLWGDPLTDTAQAFNMNPLGEA